MNDDFLKKEQEKAFSAILGPFKPEIEKLIKEKIHSFGDKTPLKDACEYALLNGGKRFRPALVFLIARAIGKGANVSQAALAVEFFHTASLIADDLPCMDNDDERRNKPSLHKVFGETVSLLASYALIAAGYECLSKNSQEMKLNPLLASKAETACVLALENVSYNTGILGATGGQFLDLYPPNNTLETLREVIHKKTISLFEVAFVLGWLFGGGDVSGLPLIKKAASHFGMAFQLADDIGDRQQDLSTNRKANVALILGVEKAKELFHGEIRDFLHVLEALKLTSGDLRALANAIQF